ncbi:hypothetical protein [Sphingomonas sp.]|jgi:hypothetical protein|uniref:hypothetical protein n=1 Tax=Sphingomonas sp. TaxID=28214 RepID=UPI002DE1F88B|nr:hypothetical protein [Sphingomonas sp.]
MRTANQREQEMQEGQFIAVSLPSRSEGVGRALQAAFRDGLPLPADMQRCIQQLDRIRA